MSDEYLTYSERKYKILILQIAVLRLIRFSWYYISTVCVKHLISLHILWKLFIVPLNCHHGVFVISHLLIPIMQYGNHILCYHKNNCIQQQICKYVATCTTWMIQFIDTFGWKRILKFFMFAMASLVLVYSIFTFHLCTLQSRTIAPNICAVIINSQYSPHLSG